MNRENAARLLVDEGCEPDMQAAYAYFDRQSREQLVGSMNKWAAAAHLVGTGEESSIARALLAIEAARGEDSGKVPRVLAQLADVEDELNQAMLCAKATMDQITAELAAARSHAMAVVNGRDSAQEMVARAEKKLKEAAGIVDTFSARRARASAKVAQKIAAGYAEGATLAADEQVSIEVALGHAERVREQREQAVAEARAHATSFEGKHAKDLELVDFVPVSK